MFPSVSSYDNGPASIEQEDADGINALYPGGGGGGGGGGSWAGLDHPPATRWTTRLFVTETLPFRVWSAFRPAGTVPIIRRPGWYSRKRF